MFALTPSAAQRSTDNGKSWEKLTIGADTSVTILHLAKDGRLFIGTQNGHVLRSTDRGNNWTSLDLNKVVFGGPPSSGGLRVATISSNPGDKVFVGTAYFQEGKAFFSRDNGDSWNSCDQLPGRAATSGMNSQGTIFIRTEGDEMQYCHAFRSTDDGQNWIEIMDLPPRLDYLYSLEVDDSDNVFAYLDNQIYRSSDYGVTFKVTDTSFTIRPAILRTGQDHALYAGTDHSMFKTVYTDVEYSNLYRSTDAGMSWDTLVRPNLFLNSVEPNNHRLQAIGSYRTIDREITFLGTDGKGAFRSTEHGANYTHLTNGILMDTVYTIAVGNRGDVYVGGVGGVFHSPDTGTSWHQVMGASDRTTVTSLLYGRDSILYAGRLDSGVVRSTDGGLSWTKQNDGLYGSHVFWLRSDSVGNIYTATEGGIYRSFDHGDSWLSITGDFPIDSIATSSFLSDRANNYFLGTSSGMYISTDRGASWHRRGLQDTAVAALGMDTRGNIFACTNEGVYGDAGGIGNHYWQALNNNLLNRHVLSIDCNPLGTVFIGTDHGGTYWCYLLTPLSVKDDPNFPAADQHNFTVAPNPASASITLTLNVQTPTEASVTVVSATGATVATRPLGQLERGDYTYKLATTDIPQGIYFVRVRMGGHFETQTLLIER
jgi:photosystem II stability/assembly factor-like uncharacterized protein